MSSRYEVGDRVTVVDDIHAGMDYQNIGESGVVQEMFDWLSWDVKVLLDNDNIAIPFSDDELAPEAASEFSIGDRVTILFDDEYVGCDSEPSWVGQEGVIEEIDPNFDAEYKYFIRLDGENEVLEVGFSDAELEYAPVVNVGTVYIDVEPNIVFRPRPRVYIAGPMTGYPDHNFPAFNVAAEKLEKLGFDVFNPAKLGVVEGYTHGDYLRYDLPHLCNCDVIYMLEDWEPSDGACLEIEVAAALGMPVMYE